MKARVRLTVTRGRWWWRLAPAWVIELWNDWWAWRLGRRRA